MSSKWPEELEKFIKTAEWTFAKTYAQTWPHEYLSWLAASNPDRSITSDYDLGYLVGQGRHQNTTIRFYAVRP